MAIAALIVALFGMVSLAGAVSVAAAAQVPLGYPGPGDTIRINNDAELVTASAAFGWNGTGTIGDPFILDGTLDDPVINMQGADAGIYVANITTNYFVITNWTIYNSPTDGRAINIQNVRTIFEIDNIEVNDSYIGIFINRGVSPEVSGCYIQDCNTGIRIENSTYPTVTDNTIIDQVATLPAIHYGVFLRYCINGFVDSNTLLEVNEGVELEYCRNIHIGSNSVTNCVIAFYLDQASVYTAIHDNVIENMQEWGITLNYDAGHTSIDGNDIRNCTWSGIDIARSNDAKITDNSFYNCTRGIYTRDTAIISSKRTTISDNAFIECDTGVRLNLSDNGIITYNSFIDCLGYGIMLTNGAGNNLHHNVFQDCNGGGIQGYDSSTGVNHWNDSVGFGNHWSDWVSPDAQDDGIVDVPYALDGGEHEDLYPLTYSIGPVQELVAIAGAGPSVLVNWAVGNYSAGDHPEDSNYIITRTEGGGPWTTDLGHEYYLEGSIAPGTYTYNVTNSNEYGESSARNVTVVVPGANIPVVNITSPEDDSVFNVSSIMVEWEGSGMGSPVDKYQARLDALPKVDVGLALNYTFSDIAEGTHIITIIITNEIGNTDFDTVSVTVDTIAPSISFIYPTEGSIVSDSDVNVQWSGTDATTGVKNYSISVDSGAWEDVGLDTSFLAEDLEDGDHVIQLRAYDNAGNSAIESVSFIVDTTPPEIIFIQPADGSITNQTDLLVLWNITDASGVNYSWIRLANTTGVFGEWVNITNLESVMTSDLTVGEVALTDGIWTLEIASVDIVDNNGSAQSQFTVDTVAPVITDLAPAGGYLNTNITQFTWNVTDATSGVNRTLVSIDSGLPIDIGFLKNFTTQVLSDGWHWFNVTAVDNASNSASASVQFFVDTQAPIVSISMPSQDAKLNVSTVHFEWVGVDPSPGSGIDYYEYDLDGAGWTNIGSLNQTDIVLSEGNHTFKVRAFDLARNPSEEASVNVTVDLTAPTLSIVSPTEGALIGLSDVQVVWEGSDNLSGIQGYNVSIDGSAWQSVNISTDHTFIGLSDGSHNVKVNATDNAGNSVTREVNFTIDTTPPMLVISSPSEGAIFAVNWTVIEWTAIDNTSSVASVSLRLDDNAWTNVTGLNSFNLTMLSDGIHSVHLRAIDAAGNAQEKTLSIVVDLIPPMMTPVTPSVNMNGVLRNTAIIITFNEEMLTASVTLSPSVGAGTYSWNEGRTQLTFTPSTNLAYATLYSVTVSGTDLAGNPLAGASSWSFTTIAHVIGTVLNPDGKPIANATVNMTSDGFSREVKTSADGSFSIDVPTGTYNLTISASGMKELKNEVQVRTGTNDLGAQKMNALDDWTWLIVGLIAVVVLVAISLVLLRRRPRAPQQNVDELEKVAKKLSKEK